MSKHEIVALVCILLGSILLAVACAGFAVLNLAGR